MTIGGGAPFDDGCGSTAGFVDGNTRYFSQFDGPIAIALNSQGTLFVADQSNNAVRMVTLVGDLNNSTTVTSPIFTNLHSAVGVAVDAADNLYVLTRSNNVQGRNALIKYNNSFNLLYSNLLPYSPSALALSQDAASNIFVAFTNGIVLQYAQSGNVLVSNNTVVASGSKLKPGGLAWRNDGVLAVSDMANNAIYLLAGTNTSVPTLYAGNITNGGTTAGWVDGFLLVLPSSHPNRLTGLVGRPPVGRGGPVEQCVAAN